MKNFFLNGPHQKKKKKERNKGKQQQPSLPAGGVENSVEGSPTTITPGWSGHLEPCLPEQQY